MALGVRGEGSSGNVAFFSRAEGSSDAGPNSNRAHFIYRMGSLNAGRQGIPTFSKNMAGIAFQRIIGAEFFQKFERCALASARLSVRRA